MDLVVATPGVPTVPLRAALAGDRGQLLVVDRSTRCGATTVDPREAARLRVAVVPCSVSLHAADRLRHRFDEMQLSVDCVIVGPQSPSSSVTPWMDSQAVDRLVDRFDCRLVRATEPDNCRQSM